MKKSAEKIQSRNRGNGVVYSQTNYKLNNTEQWAKIES